MKIAKQDYLYSNPVEFGEYTVPNDNSQRIPANLSFFL